MRVLGKLLFLVSVASCLIYQPLYAAVYKWVDENGVTQYSATPPPKGNFNKLKEPPPPADGTADTVRRLEQQNKAFSERRGEQLKASNKQKQAQAKAAQNVEKCKKARDNLSYFQARTRIRYLEEDGTATFLSEEQRQQRMKGIQKRIDAYCK